MKLFSLPVSDRKINWKILVAIVGLLLSANLTACSTQTTSPDAMKGDAMKDDKKGDAMKGDAMKDDKKGDAMKGDAMKSDKK